MDTLDAAWLREQIVFCEKGEHLGVTVEFSQSGNQYVVPLPLLRRMYAIKVAEERVDDDDRT